MSEWKVSAERINIFPHPDKEVENLIIARVGTFTLILTKNSGYKENDIVIFAPKRTVLPNDLRWYYVNGNTGDSYLRKNSIVRSCRFKGILSEGVVIPKEYVLYKLKQNSLTNKYPEFVDKTIEDIVGVDISKLLEMSEYVNPLLKFNNSSFNVKKLKIELNFYLKNI